MGVSMLPLRGARIDRIVTIPRRCLGLYMNMPFRQNYEKRPERATYN